MFNSLLPFSMSFGFFGCYELLSCSVFLVDRICPCLPICSDYSQRGQYNVVAELVSQGSLPMEMAKTF